MASPAHEPDHASIVSSLVAPMEEAADRLEKRGERLLREAEELSKQGRMLLEQAAELGVGANALRTSTGMEPVEEPAPSNGAHGAVTLEKARDKARELREFRRPELAEALGISLVTVGRWLNHLQTHGYITAQGQTRSRRFVWNDQKEAGQAFLAQQKLAKRELPETTARTGTVTPIAGSGGGGQRATNPEVRELIAEAKAAGCDVVMGGGGHWKVSLNGQMLCTFPNTPSDSRSVKNAKANLRRKLATVG